MREGGAEHSDEGGPGRPGNTDPRGLRGLRPRTRRGDPSLDASMDPAPTRRRQLPEEDDEDDIETVFESKWGERAPLEDMQTEEQAWVAAVEPEDAQTERRERMPVGFISDAVMDEQTVEDPASAAVRWRDDAAFNYTPTMPRAGTPVPPAPAAPPRPAAVAASAEVPPPPPAGLRTVTPAGQAEGVRSDVALDRSMSPVLRRRRSSLSGSRPAEVYLRAARSRRERWLLTGLAVVSAAVVLAAGWVVVALLW